MNRESVEVIVTQISETCGFTTNDFGLDSQLYNDLGMDSLDKVEFLFQVESKFGLSLPEETWMEWETLNDVVDTVCEYKLII